jgi:sigma-B regulation protein RsbU (phosphoserine phosphatase)
MPCKILVADDEPDLQDLVRQIFRARIRSGELIFEFAENGAIALDKLQSDPVIDLLFTDINMPVMDGLSLLSKMKEHELLPKAVVISAYGDLKNIRAAMNRGAFDFITKPIDITDLEATLSKSIQEMNVFRQGLEARNNLEKALIEKAEAQQKALEYLEAKEQLVLHQNEILEQQVVERTLEIVAQKEIIENKNREILESIHYAKRLQEAILPSEEYIKRLFPRSFIIYEPKDIVAGDFLWVEEIDEYIFVIVADCTGHGVSGALMSMLGVSLINQVIKVNRVVSPAEILNQLHEAVINALKQHENSTNDGMDMIICRFNKAKSEMVFAGANRPMWYVHNDELVEIKTDKMPVGGLQLERKDFTEHIVELQKGDTIYLSSDGYADQFGGEHGKKLMTKNFKQLMLTCNNQTIELISEIIYNNFKTWKGSYEQIDDVLVMGIRI